MAKPFVNEPFTDFSRPEAREAFLEALARVDDELGRTYANVIDGERLPGLPTHATHDPSDPEIVVGRFPEATAEEAARAVEAADAAFPAWSETPWADRAHLLFEMADRLRREKHVFSAWMVREVGKTWAEADGDTAEAIDFCEYYAREALRYGKPVPCVQTDDQNELHYVPLGVGVIIAPWNFPLAILCGMSVAALVTGNTVVMKPAEPSLTVGRKLFELMEGVGFPRGVVNFLAGQGPRDRDGARRAPAHALRLVHGQQGGRAASCPSRRRRCGRASAGSSASWPRWAARTRSSSTRARTSTRRPRRSCPRRSASRGRSAPPARARSSWTPSTTPSSRGSSPGRRRSAWGTRPTRRRRSAR